MQRFKLLLPWLLLVLVAASFITTPALGAIALVPGGGGTKQTTSGTSIVVTIATPTTGNALILCFGANPNTATITAITGVSGGGISNWAKATSGNTNRTAEIWYGTNSDGTGTSVTITTTNAVSGSGGIANVSEWSGIKNSSPLDGTAANTAGTSQTPPTPSITITDTGSLIVGMERGGHTTFSSGPSNSFTGLSSPVTASFQAAWRIPGVLTSYTTSWTFTISNVYDTAIAAFKPEPAAGTLPAAILSTPLPTM